MEDSTRTATHQARPSNSGGAHGNRFVVSDFAKLLRWRRGHGLLDDAMMLAILDVIIPRHAQLKTTLPLDKALGQWVNDHTPEIVKTYGAEWIEARRVEIMSQQIGSFPTMDEIAEHFRITQDEVDGACLCSLVAFGNPKRDRESNNKARNKARQGEARIEKGAKPHSKSKARMKPWVAMGLSRSAYYEKGLHKAPSADGKDAWTDSSDAVPPGRIRQRQSVDIANAHVEIRNDRGDGGAPTRTRIEVGDRDVSDDWRAFMQARRLPETVELPF